MTTTLSAEWISTLQHMLGARPDQPVAQHGFHNHYCCDIQSIDYYMLRAMADEGLVKPGRIINDGRDQYFHATLTGCKAIGLSVAAIDRAFSG